MSELSSQQPAQSETNAAPAEVPSNGSVVPPSLPPSLPPTTVDTNGHAAPPPLPVTVPAPQPIASADPSLVAPPLPGSGVTGIPPTADAGVVDVKSGGPPALPPAAAGSAAAGGEMRYHKLCPSVLKHQTCWAKASGKTCFFAFHDVKAAVAAGVEVRGIDGGTDGIGADLCFKCGRPGHIAIRCPNRDPRDGGGRDSGAGRGGGGFGGGGRGGGGGGKTAHSDELNPLHVYVAHLPLHLTKPDVERMFSPFGKLNGLQILTEKGSGKSRGVAFIHFAMPDDAQAAIAKYNGFQMSAEGLVKLAKWNAAVDPKAVELALQRSAAGGGYRDRDGPRGGYDRDRDYPPRRDDRDFDRYPPYGAGAAGGAPGGAGLPPLPGGLPPLGGSLPPLPPRDYRERDYDRYDDRRRDRYDDRYGDRRGRDRSRSPGPPGRRYDDDRYGGGRYGDPRDYRGGRDDYRPRDPRDDPYWDRYGPAGASAAALGRAVPIATPPTPALAAAAAALAAAAGISPSALLPLGYGGYGNTATTPAPTPSGASNPLSSLGSGAAGASPYGAFTPDLLAAYRSAAAVTGYSAAGLGGSSAPTGYGGYGASQPPGSSAYPPSAYPNPASTAAPSYYNYAQQPTTSAGAPPSSLYGATHGASAAAGNSGMPSYPGYSQLPNK